jgi:outer membrane lipoprotein LolB
MTVAKAVAALGALLLMSGCALLAPRESVPRAESFDLLGRVLVGYDGRAFSSHVRWRHDADNDELWLMTPTGQTLAQLREDASGATLTAADQTRYHGTHVEGLTRQALGWEFPLARLQHWVRGAPAPHVPSEITERDGGGRILRMTQDGWRVAYEYSAAPEYGGLPRRVEVSGEAQNIRLVIDSWRREPEAAGAPDIFITR